MIHQYRLNGYNIIVDANSASVHTVDEAAYDIAAAADRYVHDGRDAAVILRSEEVRSAVYDAVSSLHDISREDTCEVLDDLASLADEGLIWSADPYEEAAGDLKIKQSVLKAICLHVAHGCNMDCEYCFAGKGDYSGKSGIMSLDTGKRALDYLVENSGSRKHLEVDFFGGEPLINW